MTIYLEDKRRERAGWGTKIQHLVAGIPLFFTGLSNFLHEPAERPMAVLEMAVAIIVVLAFVKEARDARHRAKHGGHGHPGVGWFDLAAGGLLIFEAFHGARSKPGYLRPQFLSGIATLAIGLFHGRIHGFHHRRRYLKLDETGMDMRLGRFRRIQLLWTELASAECGSDKIILQRSDGRRHEIDLRRYRNRMAIEQGIAEHVPAKLLAQ